MADIQKSYIYQIYKGTVFLGVLQNVSSDFTYSQDINSNAVALSVEVDMSADVADIPVTPILDETKVRKKISVSAQSHGRNGANNKHFTIDEARTNQ